MSLALYFGCCCCCCCCNVLTTLQLLCPKRHIVSFVTLCICLLFEMMHRWLQCKCLYRPRVWCVNCFCNIYVFEATTFVFVLMSFVFPLIRQFYGSLLYLTRCCESAFLFHLFMLWSVSLVVAHGYVKKFSTLIMWISCFAFVFYIFITNVFVSACSLVWDWNLCVYFFTKLSLYLLLCVLMEGFSCTMCATNKAIVVILGNEIYGRSISHFVVGNSVNVCSK